jgi:hypothetical protein
MNTVTYSRLKFGNQIIFKDCENNRTCHPQCLYPQDWRTLYPRAINKHLKRNLNFTKNYLNFKILQREQVSLLCIMQICTETIQWRILVHLEISFPVWVLWSVPSGQAFGRCSASGHTGRRPTLRLEMELWRLLPVKQ